MGGIHALELPVVGLLIGPLVALLVLSLVFWGVERVRPASPARSWRQRGLDVVYWLLRPVGRGIAWAITLVLVLPVVVVFGLEVGPEASRGFGPVGAQPAWLQAIELLVLIDATSYWVHRWFHQPGWRWRAHAVHHSSEQLDWLSATRGHPLDEGLAKGLRGIPVLLLGFDPLVLAGVAPFFAVYAIALHANVRASFGPLRYVVVSPAFHRWHHAKHLPARFEHGVNFAGLFPVWDLLFGTFYLPAEAPAETGVGDHAVPDGLVGQMRHPFSRQAAR